VVPVEHAGDGEEVIFRTRVGNVADERVDVVFVVGQPSWIQIADDCCGVDEIPVVEMMVVVVGVSEVGS
jgi:hypothetical protein